MEAEMNIKIEHGGSAVYLLKLRGRVIYVGQSCNVLGRFTGHISKKFDEVEILWMPKRLRLKEEKRLIKLYAPRLNGNRRKNQPYAVNIPENVHRIIKALTKQSGMKLGAWVSEKLREAAEQERAK
jgi:hypothetical protein